MRCSAATFLHRASRASRASAPLRRAAPPRINPSPARSLSALWPRCLAAHPAVPLRYATPHHLASTLRIGTDCDLSSGMVIQLSSPFLDLRCLSQSYHMYVCHISSSSLAVLAVLRLSAPLLLRGQFVRRARWLSFWCVVNLIYSPRPCHFHRDKLTDFLLDFRKCLCTPGHRDCVSRSGGQRQFPHATLWRRLSFS